MDLKDTFSSIRLVDIAQRHGLGEGEILSKTLESVSVAKPTTSAQLLTLVETVEEQVRSGCQAKLVGVDGATILYAEETANGRGEEAFDRLNTTLWALRSLASENNVAVLITNEVYANIGGTGEAVRSRADLTIGHHCRARLYLRKVDDKPLQRIAKIHETAESDGIESSYMITSGGIANYVE